MGEKLTNAEKAKLLEKVRDALSMDVLTRGDMVRVYEVLNDACDRRIEEIQREVGVVDATGGRPQ